MATLLVRLPNWLGDAVMATPVLKALAAQEGEFLLLGRPFLKPLFEVFPGVKGFIPLANGKLGIFRTAKAIRPYGFKRGLLLPNSFSSALIYFLAGIPERMGYATDGRRYLLTKAVRPPRLKLHQRDYYLHLISSLGYEIRDRELELFIPEKIQGYTTSLLSELSGPYAVLAPGAAYGPAKRWPEDRFRALAVEFIRRGFSVVVVGGPAEKEAGEKILADLPHSCNLCGRTDLLAVSAVIAKAAVFVSNDSGLMHVAAALKRPQVAIFGSTDPEATGPLNPRAKIVRKDLPCSPCLKRTCKKGYLCLVKISVEEVLEKALEVCNP